MKIAFIGAHGVGKTTLCYDLAARLKRQDLTVDLVMEVARDCPLPINRDTTRHAQSWILHTQIAEELARGGAESVVICDRSVLDNYAYFVHQGGRDATYDALVQAWVGSYDHLFKVPIVTPPSWDGTRDTNAEFQRRIDAIIDELGLAFGVHCHRLDPAARDGWVDAVLALSGLPAAAPQIEMFRVAGA